MAHRRNKSYLSTCCQKNVTAISNREDDTWRRGAGGRKKERKYTTMCIFTSAHKHTRHAPTQIHRRDMELSSVDKQMTDKWHVGTPPPGLIVIALWDCANGISYGEREGGERGLCVILHKQNLCQTPDVIASTAVNCVQSNLSVNLGFREWGHG